MTPVHIIGVPLDLGAGRRGVDMGPSALRIAGIGDQLTALGRTVVDKGDLPAPIAETQRPADKKKKYIRDIAKACKSKNAGPFELTIDVVFDERSMYERVRATGVLGPELFARLYHVRPEDVLFSEYPAGNAFKATIPRLVASGDVGDTDVYGAQQHAPLLDVEIPL